MSSLLSTRNKIKVKDGHRTPMRTSHLPSRTPFPRLPPNSFAPMRAFESGIPRRELPTVFRYSTPKQYACVHVIRSFCSLGRLESIFNGGSLSAPPSPQLVRSKLFWVGGGANRTFRSRTFIVYDFFKILIIKPTFSFYKKELNFYKDKNITIFRKYFLLCYIGG